MTGSRCSRCLWDELYIHYHDTERGIPVHDDQKHFEMLTLESQQAGLSRLTILKRREGYRQAFDQFNPEKIAHYDENKLAALLQDPRIICNKKKILAIINNAQCFLQLQSEFGSFDHYIRSWTAGQTIYNQLTDDVSSITRSPLSDRIAQDLKARGFSFVGSIMVYSRLQAIGIINDHVNYCFRAQELSSEKF